MANNSEKVRGSSWQWTNERHVSFLNSMEASFVHSMLENNGRDTTNVPPLDRYLPDTSDSTRDLGRDRRTRLTFLSDNVESSGRRTEKKTRNLGCQKSSQDQVVPQFPNKRDDKDKDKDDRDHFDVSIGTAH